VRPASYRDAWLAEGLATFSGLWYVQSVRKRNDEYFKFLDRYATNVRDLSDDVGAIWLGRRNWEPRYKLAGTYDQKWLDDVFPFLPADFDERYYQAAPEDQQVPWLKGGDSWSAFTWPRKNATSVPGHCLRSILPALRASSSASHSSSAFTVSSYLAEKAL